MLKVSSKESNKNATTSVVAFLFGSGKREQLHYCSESWPSESRQVYDRLLRVFSFDTAAQTS